jgi:hypothetical protein
MLTPSEIRKAFERFSAALAAAYEQACANDPGLAAEVEWEEGHGERGWLEVAADREARGGAGRTPC